MAAVRWKKLHQPEICTFVKREAPQRYRQKYIIGDGECQDEAGQVLPNARKNIRASKNNAIKLSAEFNAKPRSLLERRATRAISI
jgi:prophage tail gpP-like protein